MNFIKNKTPFVSAKSDDFSEMPNTENCQAIVLAGGSGLPGSGLIPAKMRGQRPAHFCRTQGSEYVINKTRKQIEKVFSARDVMFVVTEEHARYYEEVLADVKPENLIVQPQDDGTTTAILYAALQMVKKNPSAVLAFFPPDFHAPNADEFMRRVESACAFARRESNLILLGITPDDAANENELIEFDSSAPVDKNLGVWRVRRFSTQATEQQTRQLFSKGALLNSSVMVGTPPTFLRKIRRAAPEIYDRFSLAAERIGTINEQRAVRTAYYSQYEYTDFSRDVLEKSAEKLMVVPVPASLKSAVGIKPSAVSRMPETVVNPAPKFYTAQVGT